MYSSSLSWLSLGFQSAALDSGRIPFIPAMLMLEQGQQLLPRLNHGLLDKEQTFSLLATGCVTCISRVLLQRGRRYVGDPEGTDCIKKKKKHGKWMENQLGSITPSFRHLILAEDKAS